MRHAAGRHGGEAALIMSRPRQSSAIPHPLPGEDLPPRGTQEAPARSIRGKVPALRRYQHLAGPLPAAHWREPRRNADHSRACSGPDDLDRAGPDGIHEEPAETILRVLDLFMPGKDDQLELSPIIADAKSVSGLSLLRKDSKKRRDQAADRLVDRCGQVWDKAKEFDTNFCRTSRHQICHTSPGHGGRTGRPCSMNAADVVAMAAEAPSNDASLQSRRCCRAPRSPGGG